MSNFLYFLFGIFLFGLFISVSYFLQIIKDIDGDEKK